MTRVDLDIALNYATLAADDATTDDADELARFIVPALVAELRPAREVVAAADLYWTTFGDEAGGTIPDRLAHALNAYDEAVAS